MKKYCKLLIALAVIVLSATVASAKGPEGKWMLLTENGKAFPGITNSVKVVDKKGNFTVLWSFNNGRTYKVMQQGTWSELMPGVIVEECKKSGIGSVALSYKVTGKKMSLTFSYPNEPKRVIVQEYIDYDTYLKQMK